MTELATNEGRQRAIDGIKKILDGITDEDELEISREIGVNELPTRHGPGSRCRNWEPDESRMTIGIEINGGASKRTL